MGRARAFAESGDDLGSGYSLRFARWCAGAPALHASAIDAWHEAKHRHQKGTPPAGTFVFWDGGLYGDVAVSDGDGFVWALDGHLRGRVARMSIAGLGIRPGRIYLGWTEDINGVLPQESALAQ